MAPLTSVIGPLWAFRTIYMASDVMVEVEVDGINGETSPTLFAPECRFVSPWNCVSWERGMWPPKTCYRPNQDTIRPWLFVRLGFEPGVSRSNLQRSCNRAKEKFLNFFSSKKSKMKKERKKEKLKDRNGVGWGEGGMRIQRHNWVACG